MYRMGGSHSSGQLTNLLPMPICVQQKHDFVTTDLFCVCMGVCSHLKQTGNRRYATSMFAVITAVTPLKISPDQPNLVRINKPALCQFAKNPFAKKISASVVLLFL